MALLFIGTIIPLFTRNPMRFRVSQKSEVIKKSIKENLINYIAFTPLIGLCILSYRIPLAKIDNLRPEMIVLAEVSLVVITFLVIVSKRTKIK